jgi:hypothetical protein
MSLSPVDPNLTSKLTPEQKDYIYKLSRSAHFIKTVKRLAPETVGGDLSYHFIFDFDRAGINAYLQSLKEYINTIGKNDSALSAFDPTTFAKELDNLKDFQGEIWIGHNNKLIHKVTINFATQPDTAKDEKIKINIVGIMSGWNQPVSIVAPAESTPFADLISSSLGDAQNKGKDAATKAYMSGMRAQAEIYYDSNNTSYFGFCSSKELKTATKNIKDSGGTGFVCKAIAQNYAISVKLPSSSGYWCVDSTGTSKATATAISGTVCPAK